MKKNICLLCSILCVMCLLWGCGSSDPLGNASIIGDWQLVEMIINEQTLNFKDTHSDIPIPQFSCADGKNFTLLSNGKSHSGTLTKSEDVYTLNYNDDTKTMEARISGNRMTITVVGSDSIELIFETK